MIASQRLASRVAVAFAIVACTREARADDSAAAQALFDQAKKAMTAHDYASACPKLEESYRLEQGLGTLLNLADCYEHEDKLAGAWSKFLEVATLARSAGNTGRAQIGKQRAAALRPRVSSLVVTAPATPAAGLEVKRDGTVLGEAEWGTPIPADAGPHLFEATAPGRRPWSTTVNVEDGGSTLTVRVPDLDLLPVEPAPAEVHPLPEAQDQPAAPPPARGHLGTQRALAIASGGLGVVAIGVGTFFGIQSMSKHNEAAKACPQTVCPLPDPQNGLNLWNDARTDGNVSTVAFVVGAVGVAGMAALWFTAPTGPADNATRVGLGIGSVRLQGVW
jgi:hypothetical protein